MKLPAWIVALFSGLSALLLPACDAVNLPQIQPGVTTQAEVRQRLGEPGAVHANADGTATWEYSRQPAGVDCWMIRFDDRQVVAAVDQALSAENLARIVTGMPEADVLRQLGRPATRIAFGPDDVLEWHVRSDFPGEEAYFAVHVRRDDGRVVKTASRVQPKG